MFKLIQIDGTDLICYDNGDIWRFGLQTKKWKKFVSESKDYWEIGITNNKKTKRYLNHRLTANAFLGLDLNSKLVVDHIDHNIHNNSVDNLRCITIQQNSFNTNAKGYSKISYIKKDGTESVTWRIKLQINGKEIKKYVKTEEEAIQGYLELKRIHHII